MSGVEQELPHEPQGQEQSKDQAAMEKEHDRKEIAAREKEIKIQLRLKNLAEMHEKIKQGEHPVELRNGKGKRVCIQEEDPPLLSKAWETFDKLLEVAGGPREHHQEMGVKLVSTDLLSLKGLMKEGFVAAKASDEKVGERLTKVAQRMDWEREVDTLKKELEKPSQETEAIKAEMTELWAGNEAIRQVNQTLNKVNDVLRAYLQVQQTSFQAKEAEWEKRIKDLEARCAQQAPTAVVDWTEVQAFEIRGQPAEEAFKCQKEEEGAGQQKGEEIPLLDKEMLQPEEIPTRKEAEGNEFEWQMPSILALEQVHAASRGHWR
ncbi:hypothetical protein CBR_g17612 [Chara braunii]|uniref:Uncharacterized protein n=1 Tax=Chara braunii TaxID=69332 RepID=A0A388KV30_CHABU|nr:hypothetical protein CBR_g17612 [Chara braunii]|eukprot:GBG73897.1 hypothetical protein CBR_g17612 [Chara braunii]